MTVIDAERITIETLMEFLSQFPVDSTVHAYEGEDTAIVISGPSGEELGFIRTLIYYSEA